MRECRITHSLIIEISINSMSRVLLGSECVMFGQAKGDLVK